MNSNWSYSPETVKLGRDLCDLNLWPLTLTFCMDVTFVIGNNSWKFHDDTLIGTLSKRCDGRTDGQTDGRTDWTIHRAAWSQLKIKTWGRVHENTELEKESFLCVFFKLVLQIDILSTYCEIGFRSVPQNSIDDKSTLAQVMVLGHRATSYHLSQCWPRFVSR